MIQLTEHRWLAAIISGLTILLVGINNLKTVGLASLWTQGLGTIEPNAIFTGSNASGSNGIFWDIILIKSTTAVPSGTLLLLQRYVHMPARWP